jgi:Uma2 family endonuclease
VSTTQQPKVHRFNLTQYYELGEHGLLDKPTELLEGIITDMEPIGPWHANVGDILAAFSTNKLRTVSGSAFSIRLTWAR